MNSLITALLITLAIAIVSQWIIIGVIMSLKQEENIDVTYTLLFIAYIVIFILCKEQIELHFYEISLTFIIISLILNWIYSNYLYVNNDTPVEEKSKSIAELFIVLIDSIKLITPKNIKNINQDIKKEVKLSINKQRIILYALAFICSIFAHYGTNKPLDSSFTTFIIFDVAFTLFLEKYYFKT